MLKIYSAENMVDAQLFKDTLESDGIEALIKGGYLSGAVGELPPAGLIAVWIIEDFQEKRAKALLTAFESQRQKNNNDIYCGKCGNKNPGSFELCWSCGHQISLGL